MQTTVSTKSLELVNFEREVIKKNKALFEEIKVLQNTVSKEQAPRAVVEDKLNKFKSSISASDAMAAKLAESDEALETTHANVVSLKKRVARTDTKKADCDKLVAQVSEKLEHCRVRVNVALVGRNRVKELTRLLMKESVKAVDTVVQ